ncbi:thioredoxin family protein [Saccharibacillus sp. CPCC 101409]|uniref:thioredoxin family protein n=1 Tax=Saccharibacillus sp. CPCC 101409 TaxID=3058041 RepID=UPI0026716427|nr:thioredoxin family protein [Saccharibacillus sp. CPCC 101409]MDO3408499.1 thioredoxin family protein [Saccharibacillus sp. CPCC 101409]
MDRIESKEQYNEQIGGEGLTVIKFDTNWCPDCKNLDRFIGGIIENNQDKQFFAMDAEKFQDIAESNEVRGIPSLLVFKNGEKIAHLHSKFAKTPAQVSEYLESVGK